MIPPDIILKNRFAVLDIETTGVNHFTDEVVQVGIVQVDNGRPGMRAWTFVKPEKPIPQEATALHGITNAMVSNAPRFRDIAPDIVGLVGERCIVGYNVAGFDVPFLRRKMAVLGPDWGWNPAILDVFHLVRKYDKKPETAAAGYHKLAQVAARYGLAVGKAHDAIEDCRMAWSVFDKLAREIPEIGSMTCPVPKHESEQNET